MNPRDDFFYQAVIYAKEKNYSAARAMLRNLLFQYPDDIEGLLLYSIVSENRTTSIRALKEILKLDPDHEIAFAKLTKLKHAPPSSIPSPTVPLPAYPIPSPSVKPAPAPQPEAPEQMISRKKLEPSKTIEPREDLIRERRRKKGGVLDSVLIGLLVIACMCASLAAMQAIYIFVISNP